MKVFRLSLQSTYEESEKVPDFVSDIQEKIGLDEDITGKLMLVLSEAATNAIVHGNELDESKKIEIELIFSNDKIVASVQDEGAGFDPEDSTEDPLSEENLLKAGGRGVFLIKKLADSVKFSEGGTKVTFEIWMNSQ